ncbi:MAG TPA: slipin family protein [Candidatus Eisenbacteria bacterium]
MNTLTLSLLPVLFLVGLIILGNSVRVLREYERAVVFRLGRLIGVKGPGLILLLPMIDRMVKVPLRVVAMDVPAQDIITKDNISIKVNAVLYFKVTSAQEAVIEVENYLYATSQIAQTSLRSVVGEHELDDLLAERDKINIKLQQIIDERTEPWGVKVTAVEVKDVDLPQEMQRAIARQAEAERERRAKIIHAEGEYTASLQLAAAAGRMSAEPLAIQLRYLQTLTEIATEKNSTIVFPLPIDLIKVFLPADAAKRLETTTPVPPPVA